MHGRAEHRHAETDAMAKTPEQPAAELRVPLGNSHQMELATHYSNLKRTIDFITETSSSYSNAKQDYPVSSESV